MPKTQRRSQRVVTPCRDSTRLSHMDYQDVTKVREPISANFLGQDVEKDSIATSSRGRS